jgi:hypothetical protein
MTPQFDNILMTSMLLWLDNKILTKGQAYTNFKSMFYPLPNMYYGYYTYGAPFKQMVIDCSISGANIISGVYINGTFTIPGENNLTGIDSLNGQLYFTSPVSNATTALSGNYAVKDFNIYLTSQPEEKLLFESQYQTRPKTDKTLTGLAIESITYPCIFLKNNGGTNEPFAFGGQDNTIIQVRAIVLADNMFSLDAVCSILKDKAREYVPLITNNPYNNFGSLNSGYYNYDSLTANIDISVNGFYISEVNVSKIFANINAPNPQVFPAFVDFTLSNIRYPRLD